MAGRAFVDCTSSLALRFASFPCELAHKHEGEHQITLKGEDFRVVFYGNFVRADVETVLRWPRAHASYDYFATRTEWEAAEPSIQPSEGK